VLTCIVIAPTMTKKERDRLSVAERRRNDPEKVKTSDRLCRFRRRARKEGLTDPDEIEAQVQEWEADWQKKKSL
jgi:Mg2+/citrate symporter